MSKFAENEKVLNLLAPQDVTTSVATASSYVNVEGAVGPIEFEIPFGALTSTDDADSWTVTVEASTAGSSNATEQAIAYRYRLSAAVDTDTLGAITSIGSTGVPLTASANDNMLLHVFVDPNALAALGSDISYLRVVLTPNDTDFTAALFGGVICRFTPAFAGNSIPSAT